MYLSNLKSYSILTKKLKFTDISNFSTKNDLSSLFNPSFNKSHGVYIFEHNEKGIIYIGSSGKINSSGIKSSQGIRLRILQSSFPYKIENEYIKFNFHGGGYIDKLFLKDLTLYFIFTQNQNFFTIPSVLEYFLIQMFFSKNRKLPLINNKI